MRNEQVIKNYFRGINCHSLNVYSIGENLINYNTIMVHFEDNIYYVNIKYYSSTTTRIQSYIKKELFNIQHDKIIYYYGNQYGDNYKDSTKQVKLNAVYNFSEIEKIGVDNIWQLNCNKQFVQFFRYYKNILIGDYIERVLHFDKKIKDSYFRYNNQRIYLNDLQLINVEKIIQLRNDIKQGEL